jgi:nucleoside-diphosphate-sugar epimerase
MATALRGEPANVYNMASGTETTIRELAETINELAGNPTPLDMAPAREWDHSGKRFGDPAKARAELGFATEMPLGEGLERTVEWTRENLDWIESCIERHREHLQAQEAAVSEVA